MPPNYHMSQMSVLIAVAIDRKSFSVFLGFVFKKDVKDMGQFQGIMAANLDWVVGFGFRFEFEFEFGVLLHWSRTCGAERSPCLAGHMYEM